MDKMSLCGMTADEIFRLIEPSGFTLSHAVSISNSIYKKRTSEISQITKIPRKLKDELAVIAGSGIFMPVASEVSVDETVKFLFRTETGKEFETVYIPDNKRHTVCVSAQSGCRMGCPFCVTARYGFRGNLSAGEIVNQIISLPDAGKVTHIVFMGMGEPMDNIDNVLKACEIITSEWGLAISPRNVTVSTVGITSGVEKFLKSSECNLTLSLHSPFNEERKRVVPVEKKYPAQKIIEIMKNYPVKKKRRFSLAYVMIKDLNDTDNHLEGLKALLKGSIIRINLLPYHPVGNDLNRSSTAERMQFFKHNLVISGISASVRKSRGIDISAACGLLATGLIN
ncbi:MAG: 23S rRNA (adenine(2503)-C(2))-methyltransferase RlmN [Bacteroidia bacterium]|nr:23S rRNA (adenine(2503)-C(2))-methyltransferase RlmN [Bacteroidia bacterium]